MTWGTFGFTLVCCYGLYYAVVLLVDLARSKTAGKLSTVGNNNHVLYEAKEPVKVQAAFQATSPVQENTVFFEDEMEQVAVSETSNEKNLAPRTVPAEAAEDLLSAEAFGEDEGYFINDKAVLNHLGLL